MLNEMAAIIGCTKTAVELTKGLIALKKDNDVQVKAVELNSILLDLQQKLLEAQMVQFSQLEELRELKEAQRKSSEFEQCKNQYSRYVFPKGGIAYSLKQDFADEQPEYYLCSNCYENDQLVTMQNTGGMGWRGLKCPRCNNTIATFDASIRI